MDFLKKILDVRSKTFWGVALGVLAILLDSVPFFPEPPTAVIIGMQIIAFLLAAFGIADAAEQSEADIIKKAKDFFSSSFGAGVVLESISHALDKILASPDAPNGAIVVAQVIGAILIAMGLRNQGAKARLNSAPPSNISAVKYQHLLDR